MRGRPVQVALDFGHLPPLTVHELRRQNPWWEGRSLRPTPEFRRWPFAKLRQRLIDPLAPVLVLRGPRQVGKTTLLEQLIRAFLEEAEIPPERIFRVQFDELDWLAKLGPDPIPRLVSWFEREIFKGDLNESAARGAPAFAFFDEVQNLGNWHTQIKALVDHTSLRVLVTGSSALRIARGRDSLAGRVQIIEVGPLRLAEIASLRRLGLLPAFQPDNGYDGWREPDFWRALVEHGERHRSVADAAFRLFAERGGYPLAHREGIGWEEIAQQLEETVVNRVIEHDLRIGERGRRRDPLLLREVFRLACRYAGQAPTLAKLAEDIQIVYGGNAGRQRVAQYLDFLHEALLLHLIDPLEMRLKRTRAPKKICLSDHVLRAAVLRETVPLVDDTGDGGPPSAELAGRIADSIVGAYLASMPGLGLAYRPERRNESEIDYVATIGDRRIPIEVKYQRRIDPVRDPAALLSWIGVLGERAPFGLLVVRETTVSIDDPRIVAIPLRSLLLLR